MTLLRMFIPGDYEDAQIYMGHLVVFTTDRRARAVELQRLTGRLETKYSDWAGLLTLAFARNDWLTGGVISSLTRNPRIAQAVNSAFDEVAKAELDPEVDTSDDDEQDEIAVDLELEDDDVALRDVAGFEQEADVVLDSEFYAGRLYLGTTDGLYDYDIDWQTVSSSPARRRIDARCVGAIAEYGAVNASCEDDGLFTGFDEFGWSGRKPGTLLQTAPRSLRTAWLGTDLINYDGPTHPELLVSDTESVDTESNSPYGHQKEIIKRFAAPHDFSLFSNPFSPRTEFDASDVQYVWNSSGKFFVNTYQSGFFSASRRHGLFQLRNHGEVDGRVEAVHPFQNGWVIEASAAVYLFANGRLTTLFESEAISVRAFAGSKRYKRLVAITTEEGVHLISAVPPF